MSDKTFECRSCGAELKFKPGEQLLHCPYCSAENPIEIDEELWDAVWEEQDFNAILEGLGGEKATVEVSAVRCKGCAAQIALDPNVTSDDCPYCGASVIQETTRRVLIKPQALLPFKIGRKEARECFRSWIKSLWFAPNKLKEYARSESKLSGIYVPYWTYDAQAHTRYRGERGEHYWDTEYYTDANGKRQSRSVRKTRWYPASGKVDNRFDDLLVLASSSLPRKYTEKLEPWDLKELTPHQEEYLSGFRSESYSIDLKAGFGHATELMKPAIRHSIHRDIGGDEQRISSMQTTYHDVTFKHILLPIWASAYRFRDKAYRFLINARTGEVQGERPWSWLKIAGAVLAAAAIAAVIAFIANSR